MDYEHRIKLLEREKEMTFSQAARKFRAHLKRSQQSMATFLGVSFAALRTYENGKVGAPDARALAAYMFAAETYGRPDLAEVFGSALHQALGLGKRESMSAAMRLMRALSDLRGDRLDSHDRSFEAIREILKRTAENLDRLEIDLAKTQSMVQDFVRAITADRSNGGKK